MYSSIGFGVRLGNESLAFKSITLAMGFIPNRFNDQSSTFYLFEIGDPPLFPIFDFEKPTILREEVIFPY